MKWYFALSESSMDRQVARTDASGRAISGGLRRPGYLCGAGVTNVPPAISTAPGAAGGTPSSSTLEKPNGSPLASLKERSARVIGEHVFAVLQMDVEMRL